MLAAHFDNLVPIIFVLVAIFFQLLTRLATKTGKRPTDLRRRSASAPPPAPPRRVAQIESDEEQVRKFLEALGQPMTVEPPQPVAPRTEIPPRPVAPVRPPLTPLAELRRKTRLPQQIPPPRAAKTFRPVVAKAPTFEVQTSPPPSEPLPVIKTADEAYATAIKITAPSPETKTDFASLLRSASGLRQAIILREIFGPPRSLQPLDLAGNV
jgi:hypothetical protein